MNARTSRWNWNYDRLKPQISGACSMELIITSIIAFASTNIDDLFILMLFFGNPRYRTKDVVTGQYLGVGFLIAVSFIGSFAGLWVDARFIGLLGLLPVYLGVRALVRYVRKAPGLAPEKINPTKNTMLSVAGISIANGGDNIGIYVPLFDTLPVPEMLVMMFILLALNAILHAAVT